MRSGLQALGVVDTIYEDDQEEDDEEEEEEEEESFNSMSPTASAFSSATPPHNSSCSPPALPQPSADLQNRVDAWTKATRCKTDVVVRVHDRCFHLHREPLTSRSGYFRRQLAEHSYVTLSPPSTITAETFAEVAASCYGSHDLPITPSNLVAFRVAAEWLEMAEGDAGECRGIRQQTESYFFHEVATDSVTAAAVLRSCAPYLAGAPEEAASAAAMFVRCVEALADSDDAGWLDDVSALASHEFLLVAESMRARFAHDHDLLYRMVDHYFQNHKGGLTEEEKSRICHTINCAKLSQHLLMHLVQNPRLPLRFVVQAMLLDQLHTRRSYFAPNSGSAAAAAPLKQPSKTHSTRSHRADGSAAGDGSLTLGAILQRDAALRQSAHVRSAMEATSQRIRSLERELAGLRQQLRWSEEKRAEISSARSASFRIVQRESVDEDEGPAVVGNSGRSCNGNPERGGRGFGWKLVHGFKSMFRKSSGGGGNFVTDGSNLGGGDGEAVEVVVKDRRVKPGHRRSGSFA